jgi:hypothetical protein
MHLGWDRIGLGAFACAGLLMAALATSCSATSAGNKFDGEGGDGNGAGSGNGSGAHGSTGEGGLFQSGSSGAGLSGAGGGDSCAATGFKAEQVPLDMYIMFDQSGSMDDTAGNTTKWKAITGALQTFMAQPGAVGIGVGIQYFPLSTGGGGGVCPASCASDADCAPCAGTCLPFFGCIAGTADDSCNAADYAKPDVEIAPLPGVTNAILQSIQKHGPTGGTPTSAALQGAIGHAREWALAHPDHVVIDVLATDGDPSSCDTDLANINAIAANGANATPKILTYVIGVGQSLSALNGIAAAGGTGQAFLVDANQNASDQFLQAMNAIRGAALACAYLIPQPPAGQEIDYNAINVQYTPDGGMPIIIPQVKAPISCPADGLAWYYDNPAKPKQIILCSSSCDKISVDKKAKVDVLVGCATVVN